MSTLLRCICSSSDILFQRGVCRKIPGRRNFRTFSALWDEKASKGRNFIGLFKTCSSVSQFPPLWPCPTYCLRFSFFFLCPQLRTASTTKAFGTESGKLHRTWNVCTKRRFQNRGSCSGPDFGYAHWAVMLTWEYTRGQLKVTCKSLTAAWQTLGSYMWHGVWVVCRARVPKGYLDSEPLLSFRVWILRVSVCVWERWASVCVCWLGANHLLIMSPWWRGHHAMYGEKCETWHSSPSHNPTGHQVVHCVA